MSIPFTYIGLRLGYRPGKPSLNPISKLVGVEHPSELLGNGFRYLNQIHFRYKLNYHLLFCKKQKKNTHLK